MNEDKQSCEIKGISYLIDLIFKYSVNNEHFQSIFNTKYKR